MDYRLEAAHQKDPSLQSNSHDSNAHADASYYTAELTTNTLGLIIGGGYEVLGAGDGGTVAFATPWATLHKFNGWDDKFLTTPTGGLKDASATLGYTHPMMGKAIMVYHEFRSDTAMSGKENLGKEWDMLYTKDIAKGLNALIKAAYYEHGDVSGYTKDTRKVWVQLDYTF